MYPFMHDPSFSSEPVLFPQLLDMNQSALPGAKQEVLQGGEHYKIVFTVHRLLLRLVLQGRIDIR
jgi:hypothetical protein